LEFRDFVSLRLSVPPGIGKTKFSNSIKFIVLWIGVKWAFHPKIAELKSIPFQGHFHFLTASKLGTSITLILVRWYHQTNSACKTRSIPQAQGFNLPEEPEN
jgi:hypothetical protein